MIGNQNDKGSLNTVRNDKGCLLVRLRLDKNNSCSWLPGILPGSNGFAHAFGDGHTTRPLSGLLWTLCLSEMSTYK